MAYKDMETGETAAHERSESKSFEKKEDMNLVKDSADKRAMRKKAMEKMLAGA
jgi:hypothetical protein